MLQKMKKSYNDSENYEIAIFEVPLADSSIESFKIGNGTNNAIVTIMLDPKNAWL